MKIAFWILIFAFSLCLSEAAPRKRVIDFEDTVVEGMNRRSLDSLSQVAEGEGKRKKNHLYKKRQGFRTEIAETLKNMRYR